MPIVKKASTNGPNKKIRRFKVDNISMLVGMLAGIGLLIFLQNSIIGPINQSHEKNYSSLLDDYDERANMQINESKLTPTVNENKKYKIPIIMYHYVENVKDRKDIIRIKLSVTPYDFEQHLRSLKENANKTVFARDIPAILNGNMVYDPKMVVLTFDDGYEDFYTEVFPLLKKYNAKATIYIIYDYIGRKDFLKYYQLKELINSGLVEIGSHTLDHLYLKEVTTQEAERQVIDSKYKLEDALGITIHTFAYPFGAYNSSIEQFAKDAGYSAAVTVVPGVMVSEDSLFHLPRVRPERFPADKLGVSLDNYRE